MSPVLHKNMLKTALLGYEFHKPCRDDKGKPVDYRFWELNSAIVEMNGLNIQSLRTGRIAINGGNETLKQFSGQKGNKQKHSKSPPQKIEERKLNRHAMGKFIEAAAAHAREAVDARASDSRTGRKWIILIAEDVRTNLLLLKALISRALPEAQILEAGNGREAVQQAEKNSIDIILMDIQMPEMDGIAAAILIRAREGNSGRHVPIIALTAGELSAERDTCTAAGMDDFLAKPINANLLIPLLQRYLGKTPIAGRLKSFDKEALAAMLDNDRELYIELLTAASDIKRQIAILGLALEDDNGEVIKKTAHKLKGSCLTMTFNALAQLTKNLELQHKKGSPELKKTFEAMTAEWTVLETLIEAELA